VHIESKLVTFFRRGGALGLAGALFFCTKIMFYAILFSKAYINQKLRALIFSELFYAKNIRVFFSQLIF